MRDLFRPRVVVSAVFVVLVVSLAILHDAGVLTRREAHAALVGQTVGLVVLVASSVLVEYRGGLDG